VSEARILGARPAQRLLVQGVIAATTFLVHHARDSRDPAALRRLMAERQRMLRQLSAVDCDAAARDCLGALQAAVAESDRTLEALCTKA
jgi:hypothetical protein